MSNRLLCDSFLQRDAQLLENKWFGHVMKKADLPASRDVISSIMAADRNRPHWMFRAQLLHQVPSTTVGQTKIAQKDIEFDSLGQGASRSDIWRNVDFVADGTEKFSQALSRVRMIFDEDNAK
jgi:hypothetical protein